MLNSKEHVAHNRKISRKEVRQLDNQKTKRSPQRTCIVCRKVQNKQDLIRLMKTSDNRLLIDQGRRQEGRGIYICPKQVCWEKALEEKWLDRTLHIKITPENRASLVEQSKNFISYKPES